MSDQQIPDPDKDVDRYVLDTDHIYRDAYDVLRDVFGVDKDTLGQLRRLRYFDDMSPENLFEMVKEHIRVFGRQNTLLMLMYKPKDMRPWLDNVIPRMRLIQDYSRGLTDRRVMELIIRDLRVIQCNGHDFLRLLADSETLIPDAAERGNFFYGYADYFALDAKKVEAFAKTHTINSYTRNRTETLYLALLEFATAVLTDESHPADRPQEPRQTDQEDRKETNAIIPPPNAFPVAHVEVETNSTSARDLPPIPEADAADRAIPAEGELRDGRGDSWLLQGMNALADRLLESGALMESIPPESKRTEQQVQPDDAPLSDAGNLALEERLRLAGVLKGTSAFPVPASVRPKPVPWIGEDVTTVKPPSTQPPSPRPAREPFQTRADFTRKWRYDPLLEKKRRGRPPVSGLRAKAAARSGPVSKAPAPIPTSSILGGGLDAWNHDKARKLPEKELTEAVARTALRAMLEEIGLEKDELEETFTWLIRKRITGKNALRDLQTLMSAKWHKAEARILLTQSRASMERGMSAVADMTSLLVNGYDMPHVTVVLLLLRYPAIATMTRDELAKKLKAASGFTGDVDDHKRVLTMAPEVLTLTVDQIGRRRLYAESKRLDPVADPRLLLKVEP